MADRAATDEHKPPVQYPPPRVGWPPEPADRRRVIDYSQETISQGRKHEWASEEARVRIERDKPEATAAQRTVDVHA